ncbi:uncharacterized protein LMH87_008035 [Akanthomyces muscarius]|uniref:Uncharacterized protein n=1 Tax=Akanthomyces muscarius TaxID=2231603 RepID=A0A9W8UQL2_AKAMU|nr:uncharacterized protein LMH87_008035 [Akanthomyces muscarius]KAJ4159120.1 hypothetical protein LMH87_008035 [Akanthomyces muscarius]
MTMISQILVALAAVGAAMAKPVAPNAAPEPTRAGDSSPSSCVHTVFHAPQYTWGPTETVWTSTATVTKEVDCGGCEELETTTLVFGPGPVVFFTTTVTASTASTTTVQVCGAATPAL